MKEVGCLGEGGVPVDGQPAVPGLPAGFRQLQGKEGGGCHERRLVNFIQRPIIVKQRSVIFFCRSSYCVFVCAIVHIVHVVTKKIPYIFRTK